VKGGVEVELTRDEIEAREEPKFWWEAEVKRMLSKMEPGSTIEALCALMFATGMEWQSAERLHKEEFLNMETREVRAFGNKTKYRNRIVVVVMDWCWDIVKRYVDNLEKGEWFLPRARDGKSKNACEGTLRDELDAAIQAAGLERHTFHNFRHSFATHWVSRGALLGALEGIDEQFLKEQLGHRDNSQELRTTYSKYNTQARIKERAPVVFQTAREQTEKEQSSKHSAFRFGRAKKSA
jgi:integrase